MFLSRRRTHARARRHGLPRAGLIAAAALLALTLATRSGDSGNASRPAFVAEPAFARFGGMNVTVDGISRPLAEAGVRYVRRSAGFFDDPATTEFEGIASGTRAFLACESDRWSIGEQFFASDVVAVGVFERDVALVEKGLAALDWGLALDVDESGVFVLHRECDDSTVEDFGGTHHTNQWLEALGRSVYLLKGSEFASRYQTQIAAYTAEIEEIAALLADEDNWKDWEESWLVDDDGNLFTHKTYMRAAALAMAASLTDDAQDATQWSVLAARIAQRGMDEQWSNGVNPERGGYDVSYQMYGVWLAETYYLMLTPSNPLRDDLEAKIDRAIEWMSGRIDRTGRVDVGDSTRTCNEENASYDPTDAIRAFLLWGYTHPERQDLVEQAVKMSRGGFEDGRCSPQP